MRLIRPGSCGIPALPIWALENKETQETHSLSTFRISHPLDLNESTVLETPLEKTETLRARTLANPFVTDHPPTCPGIKMSDALKESAVEATKVFQVQTRDMPMDDLLLPIDDVVDANKYVGDWEELYIRFYQRVFSNNEHVIYWGKSEIGIFVIAVGRAHPEFGFPTLSLGPNGYHFARLASEDIERDFPLPKQLSKLFPHFEEVKFTYAQQVSQFSSLFFLAFILKWISDSNSVGFSAKNCLRNCFHLKRK